ncbi:MAG TPA: heavy metal resistance protein CzcA, partial [Bacteroidetes bacterium]|nr:heavy metal resistance protein CzcA [Bacteroidota bacterium]
MNITLVADNREKLSGIPGMLANKGADVTMMQLATGDYMINDEIIIERKTSTDFVASIINGRLLKQCAGLRKTKM